MKQAFEAVGQTSPLHKHGPTKHHIWASELSSEQLLQVKIWLWPQIPVSTVFSVRMDHISAEIKVKRREKKKPCDGGWLSFVLFVWEQTTTHTHTHSISGVSSWKHQKWSLFRK